MPVGQNHITFETDLDRLVSEERGRLVEWNGRIEALVRKKGGTASAAEIQRIVNILFHEVESEFYDENHVEMWRSLPQVFAFLADDVQRARPTGDHWTLLDIGCGTGLATELLLQTELGPRIERLKMVDTSSKMLERCRERSTAWQREVNLQCQELREVPDAVADLVVASSVLHHLTDIVGFCRDVCSVLRPGGVFIHLQDDSRQSSASEIQQQREAEFNHIRSQTEKKRRKVNRLLRLINKLSRLGRSLLGRETPSAEYLRQCNRRLQDAHLIQRPLTSKEIWSITDLRIIETEIRLANGLCPEELAIALEGCRNVSVRTYGFYGVMPSHLPPDMLADEHRLLKANSQDGKFLAGVWQRDQHC